MELISKLLAEKHIRPQHMKVFLARYRCPAVHVRQGWRLSRKAFEAWYTEYSACIAKEDAAAQQRYSKQPEVETFKALPKAERPVLLQLADLIGPDLVDLPDELLRQFLEEQQDKLLRQCIEERQSGDWDEVTGEV